MQLRVTLRKSDPKNYIQTNQRFSGKKVDFSFEKSQFHFDNVVGALRSEC